jgi:hypothetical protein
MSNGLSRISKGRPISRYRYSSQPDAWSKRIILRNRTAKISLASFAIWSYPMLSELLSGSVSAIDGSAYWFLNRLDVVLATSESTGGAFVPRAFLDKL